MAEIKSFDITRLHQEEDFGFHKLAAVEAAKCTDEKLTPLYEVYLETIDAFDEALEPVRKDPRTETLASEDKARDSAYRGVKGQINLSMQHFDPDKAEVAKAANAIIKSYGDPTKLPYIEENGVLENLIKDLKVFDNHVEDDRPVIESTAIQTDRLSAIGAKEWLIQLEQANQRFMTLFSARNAAQAVMQTGLSTQARLNVDKAFWDWVRRINALAEVNGEETYLEAIQGVNRLIDYQQNVLTTRKGRAASKKEDDRPVIE